MKEGSSSIEEARYRAMQAVEYYNSAVLGSGMRSGTASDNNGNNNHFKTGGAIQPDSAYKSLGSVFGPEGPADNKKKLSNGTNGNVMTYNGVKSSRSVQNMAERSYSVSEVNRSLMDIT